jgi:hypothetical protein
MNERKVKPSGWIYGLAALLPLFGCLLAAVTIYHRMPSLPGTLGSITKPQDLTQVVIPGSAEITFPKAGAYAVYYEYRSVVDGVRYAGSKTPPRLDCRLRSATGKEISAVPDYVEGNAYTTRAGARAGVFFKSISIDEPGSYRFACQYPDGSRKPEIVVAVGPNLAWEFIGIAAKWAVAVLAGLAVLAASFVVAAVVAIGVAVKRRQSARAAVGG